MTVAALIQGCSVLGNDDFAEAVGSAAERRLLRRENPAPRTDTGSQGITLLRIVILELLLQGFRMRKQGWRCGGG